MSRTSTFISLGDFIDIIYKAQLVGLSAVVSMLKISSRGRVASRWNQRYTSSNYWNIPSVRLRINEKITGNPNLEYEHYFVTKYLSGMSSLSMLSIGCGAGARERKFAQHSTFNSILGIDLAPRRISEARFSAQELVFSQLDYQTCDFTNHTFAENSFDVILFNSSLHHFMDIDTLLNSQVLPILKSGGFLVVNEFVGPNRLQWTKPQLELANALLKELPAQRRVRYGSRWVKSRIYRPGKLRMLMVDPSEAVDSESILPALHRHFRVLEEKFVGGDVIQPLLKDIAHHFMDDSSETKFFLKAMYEVEDNHIADMSKSDGLFGVYQKV